MGGLADALLPLALAVLALGGYLYYFHGWRTDYAAYFILAQLALLGLCALCLPSTPSRPRSAP